MTAPRTGLPPANRARELVDWCTLAAIAAAICFVTWRLRETYPDDALIVLRYVRNILGGDGWTYNVGEAVNATTSPLHVLVLTLIAALIGGDLLLAQPIAFALPLLATLFLVHRAFRPSGRIPATIAALLVAFGPNRYTTLGMESSLLLACALGSIAAYDARRMKAAGLLLGLAVLARPDASLLAAVFAVDCLRRRTARQIAPLAAGSIAVVTPWLAYATWTFASPFPNTLAIKMAQRHFFGEGPIFLEGAWRELSAVDVRGVGFSAGAIAALFGLALAVLCARARTHRVPALFGAWAALHFSAYAMLGLPPYHWYYAPALMACALALAVGFETFWNARHHRAPQMLVAALTATVVISVAFPEVVAPQETLPHYRAAGNWVAQNTPETSSVACGDIGIVGYAAHPRRVIDMQGLITPGSSEAIARGHTAWWFETNRPDFVLVHTNAWRDFEAPVLADPLFQRLYRPLSTPELRGMRVFARRDG